MALHHDEDHAPQPQRGMQTRAFFPQPQRGVESRALFSHAGTAHPSLIAGWSSITESLYLVGFVFISTDVMYVYTQLKKLHQSQQHRHLEHVETETRLICQNDVDTLEAPVCPRRFDNLDELQFRNVEHDEISDADLVF